ncbi:receptor-like protein kinase ANXUR1 isoform X2 [Lactuca sativa]|uniref:receptor-like protein kinase ANXUR1 isoform X2 n=2 Tax=Lactuca sativa TaxID=4236 RepID=UPI000CD93269|nr:receptor-like protein kinase ANXUR1 isoform X2 [Lactuca sativa]
MLSLYKHENIVPLLGFCDDGGEKILVYKYASRRGLDLYLNSNNLTWVRRLEICIGAARGLTYLHNPGETKQRVLHRDIKSSNILLDENWNAMIADFGLSKFCPADLQYSFIFSNPVGTFGYWDPLYTETGLLTKESDVYSFGVVLFEVLCGRLCTGNHDNSQSFTELVRKHYKEHNLNGIIFGNIKDKINRSSLKVFSVIAYQCLKRDRNKRPLMNEILAALETALEYQQNDLGNTGAMDKLKQLQESVPLESRAKGDPTTRPRTATERLRRIKISEKLRQLQEVVPSMNKKTSVADILGLTLDYIKELHSEAEGPNRKRKGAAVTIGRDDTMENSKKPSNKATHENTVTIGNGFAPILNQEKEHLVKIEKNQDIDSATGIKEPDLVEFSSLRQTTMDLDPYKDAVAEIVSAKRR